MKEESGEGNLGFAGCWGIDPYGFLIFYLRGFAHGEVGYGMWPCPLCDRVGGCIAGAGN